MDIEHKLIAEKVPFWILKTEQLRNALCKGVVYGKSTGFLIKHGNEHLTIYETESDANSTPENMDYAIGDKITGTVAKVLKVEYKDGAQEIDGFLSSEHEFPADCSIKILANSDDAIMLMEKMLVPKEEGFAVVEVSRGDTTLTYRLKVIPDDDRVNSIPDFANSVSMKHSRRYYSVNGLQVIHNSKSAVREEIAEVVKSRQDIYGGWHYTLRNEDREFEVFGMEKYPYIGSVRVRYVVEPMFRSEGKLISMEHDYGS